MTIWYHPLLGLRVTHEWYGGEDCPDISIEPLAITAAVMRRGRLLLRQEQNGGVRLLGGSTQKEKLDLRVNVDGLRLIFGLRLVRPELLNVTRYPEDRRATRVFVGDTEGTLSTHTARGSTGAVPFERDGYTTCVELTVHSLLDPGFELAGKLSLPPDTMTRTPVQLRRVPHEQPEGDQTLANWPRELTTGVELSDQPVESGPRASGRPKEKDTPTKKRYVLDLSGLPDGLYQLTWSDDSNPATYLIGFPTRGYLGLVFLNLPLAQEAPVDYEVTLPARVASRIYHLIRIRPEDTEPLRIRTPDGALLEPDASSDTQGQGQLRFTLPKGPLRAGASVALVRGDDDRGATPLPTIPMKFNEPEIYVYV